METIPTTPTILIVNDDPQQLRIAAKVLESDGFAVLSCAGAEAALGLLAEHGAVDAIVTDLYMPGIDGWRFCRLLRSAAFGQFNEMPILVVSAIFSGADAEELATQLGADGFLAAPYEPAQLCHMVRGLIGNNKPVPASTVLIVEPDAGLAQVLRGVFEATGYGVTLAQNGNQALATFRREPSQIVVLDDDFAEVRPDRLIAAIKEPGTATVVMVLTSDRAAEHAVALIRQGADNYIHKPLKRAYLVQLCESAVHQRSLLRIEELLQIRTRRLRASEERYRILFEKAGDGIVTYTLDGVVVSVNHALETLVATTGDELVGKAYGKLLTAPSLVTAKAAQQVALSRNEDSWTGELALARSEGASVPVQAHCRLLGGKDAGLSMIMATYRDLSAQRTLERQRAEFTAMLAHDIRNPVGLISNCTELLLDNRGAPLDAATMRKCHERIGNAADVVASLVNNYLDASRIEAGRLDLAKRHLDLTEILQRIVERFDGEAQRRAIRFELSEPQRVVVDGDALALDRVFANLLHNAFKFTPDGGAIAINIAPQGCQTLVEVRDSGPGIDAAKLPMLFQKFSRIEVAERQEGLGLGLYIVKELVAAHGGKVEAASTLGQGSCFSVYLPLAEAA